jgi:hypothetical protein
MMMTLFLLELDIIKISFAVLGKAISWGDAGTLHYLLACNYMGSTSALIHKKHWTRRKTGPAI